MPYVCRADVQRAAAAAAAEAAEAAEACHDES